ncbi:MAG: DUF2235 domain-containing protein [Methylococcales bacterium]
MAKNIALYLDGTWNDPESRTNVRVLYEQTRGVDIHASPKKDQRNRARIEAAQQLRYYDQGVGTRFFNLFRGGVFGRGVANNIGEAYDALARHYQDGDLVYVFGFSRGAFTARTLVGVLDCYGLIDKVSGKQLAVHYLEHTGRGKACKCKAQVKKRIENNSPVKIKIKFLGVWDTVIAVGNPSSKRSNRKNKQALSDPHKNTVDLYKTFKNTNVCSIVEHAVHALALDEFRSNFQHTPWTGSDQPTISIDQRWFVGAHANVGGGYRDNHLSRIPRYWIQEQASKLGLKYYRLLTPPDHAVLEPVIDSYAAFFSGVYKQLYERSIRSPQLGENTLEDLHPSVYDYLQANRNYRPRNIPSDMLDQPDKKVE